MGADVFISYSDQDRSLADTICTAFERNGVRCWIAPRDIQPGRGWQEETLAAIGDCSALLLVFSQNANDSMKVGREVQLAVNQRTPVIPLRVENVLPTGRLAHDLGTARWHDAFPPPIDQYLDRLAQDVKALLRAAPPRTPRPRGASTTPQAPAAPPSPADITAPEQRASLSDRELLLAVRSRRRGPSHDEGIAYSASESTSYYAPAPPPPYAPAPSREYYSESAAPRAQSRRGGAPGSTIPFIIGGAAVALTGAGAFVFRHEIGALFGWLTHALFHSSATPAPGIPAAEETCLDVSAYAPLRAQRGSRFLVQVFLYNTDDDLSAIDAAADAADAGTARRGVASLDIDIARGERLDIALGGDGLIIEEPLQSLIWRGRSRSCSFEVRVPDDYAEPTALLNVRVLRDAVPVGRLRFSITVTTTAVASTPEPVGDTAKRYRRAFLSYASADRAEVIKRAQALRAGQIAFFNDLLSLEPGEEWESRLYKEIEGCDLFLLFWSRAASDSVWVRKEIEHALASARQRQDGSPEILPILIEGPPPPPPPAALADRHFNDPLLYVIAAIDKLSAQHPAHG